MELVVGAHAHRARGTFHAGTQNAARAPEDAANTGEGARIAPACTANAPGDVTAPIGAAAPSSIARTPGGAL